MIFHCNKCPGVFKPPAEAETVVEAIIRCPHCGNDDMVLVNGVSYMEMSAQEHHREGIPTFEGIKSSGASQEDFEGE